MAQTQKTWSPAKVNMNWGGELPIKGVADGTFVTAVRNSNNTTIKVGAQGDVLPTMIADKTGTITVTLLQTSETNRILSGIQALQDESGELYRADFTIADGSGGMLCYAEACHIMTTPENALGAEDNNKVWVFFSENLRYLPIPKGFEQSAGELARANSSLSALKSVSDALSALA